MGRSTAQCLTWHRTGLSDVTPSPETLQIVLTTIALPIPAPVAGKLGTASCGRIPQGQAASQSRTQPPEAPESMQLSTVLVTKGPVEEGDATSKQNTRWPIRIHYFNQHFSSARNLHSQRNWFSQCVSQRVGLLPPCPIKAQWPNITSYPLA